MYWRCINFAQHFYGLDNMITFLFGVHIFRTALNNIQPYFGLHYRINLVIRLFNWSANFLFLFLFLFCLSCNQHWLADLALYSLDDFLGIPFIFICHF